MNDQNIVTEETTNSQPTKAEQKLARQKAREEMYKLQQQKIADKKEKKLRITAEYNQLRKDYAVLKKQHRERKIAKKREIYAQEISNSEKFTQWREYLSQEHKHYQELQQEVLDKTSNELRSSRFYLFKRWFFGIGKEVKRVTWTKRKRATKDFFIVLIIVLIVVGIFFLVDIILHALKIMG